MIGHLKNWIRARKQKQKNLWVCKSKECIFFGKLEFFGKCRECLRCYCDLCKLNNKCNIEGEYEGCYYGFADLYEYDR